MGCGLAHSSQAQPGLRGCWRWVGGRAGAVGRDRRVLVEGASMAPTQAALYDELAGDLHPGRRPSFPSGARSTCTACIHTSASSSRSSSRRCSFSHVSRAGACSTRSPARGPRLVQCLESGYDAVGVDIAAFILDARQDLRVRPFRLESDVRSALERHGRLTQAAERLPGRVVRAAGCRRAPRLPLLLGDYEHGDVLRVVLARAARSARLTTHLFDFRGPAARAVLVPQHRRTCTPAAGVPAPASSTRSKG